MFVFTATQTMWLLWTLLSVCVTVKYTDCVTGCEGSSTNVSQEQQELEGGRTYCVTVWIEPESRRNVSSHGSGGRALWNNHITTKGEVGQFCHSDVITIILSSQASWSGCVKLQTWRCGAVWSVCVWEPFVVCNQDNEQNKIEEKKCEEKKSKRE